MNSTDLKLTVHININPKSLYKNHQKESPYPLLVFEEIQARNDLTSPVLRCCFRNPARHHSARGVCSDSAILLPGSSLQTTLVFMSTDPEGVYLVPPFLLPFAHVDPAQQHSLQSAQKGTLAPIAQGSLGLSKEQRSEG